MRGLDIVFACHSAACAPPPVGTGGSIGNGGGSSSDGPDLSYQGGHTPSDTGPRAFNMIEGDIAPSDIYKNPQYYTAYSGVERAETMAQLKRVQGNPDGELTIYRAVPKGVSSINDGDWITLSQRYAKNHSLYFEDESGNTTGTILSMKVKASEVRWAMDDLMEYGYFPKLKDVEGNIN